MGFKLINGRQRRLRNKVYVGFCSAITLNWDLTSLTLLFTCFNIFHNRMLYILAAVAVLFIALLHSSFWTEFGVKQISKFPSGDNKSSNSVCYICFFYFFYFIFLHVLNVCKRSFVQAFVDKIPGARVVFWDLRESFLFHLYHGTVEGARLDSIIPHFDTVRHSTLCVCGISYVITSLFNSTWLALHLAW